MPSLKDPPQPHRLGEGDAEDHQGHADGGRGEAAPRAGGGRGARPYAERMAAVLANIAAADGRQRRRADAARRHRQGPDASPRRLHRPSAALRRLQLVDRAACPRPCPPADAEGKEVKILCVGRKGYDMLRRLFAAQIVDAIELRARQADRLRRRRRRSARRVLALFAEGEFDVCDAVLCRVPVGDHPGPDRAAADPGRDRRAAPAAAPAAARSTNTSRTRKRSSPSCCRATCRSRSSARCSRTPRPSRARR